ncbi:MAG: hypothetical protein GWO78_00365 [Dehalococcoidales bacterium]|jgi:hypothetical protein|nr:hypothetical protein [Dehalococcoidales bacterium]
MSEKNFKSKIISSVEVFLKELKKKPVEINLNILNNSIDELENYFEILTNYIQDERLNLNLEDMIITTQSEKRLDNAEKLFKYTKKEFVEIRNYLSNNEETKFDKSKINIILEKFNNYIFPKIHWIFDDEKSIEITALKHLYDLGELKK